ncbi:MAG: T9SS type A sorting domain-containing protein, partial [candidate division WOR-3 bacterium]
RVRRPNGGETFVRNTPEQIRWQKFYPPRCDSLSLFYSLDNGRTYDTIITGLSGNDSSYLWTVPDTSADSCKVKIIAYGPGWQYDESDGVFAITPSGIEEDRYPLSADRLSLKILPNPAKSGVRFQIRGAGGRKLTLKIYNLAGELVKSLAVSGERSAVSEFIWDGRDDKGKRVIPGVYFIQLTDNNGTITQKAVRVK